MVKSNIEVVLKQKLVYTQLKYTEFVKIRRTRNGVIFLYFSIKMLKQKLPTVEICLILFNYSLSCSTQTIINL